MSRLARRCLTAFVVVLCSDFAYGVTVTFDGATDGVTSFAFDADGDSIDDAVFTSLSGAPFAITGPGPNQLFIQEPGLEAGIDTDPNAEIRVDFPNGAAINAGYSFALATPCSAAGPVNPALFGSIEVFDSNDVSLGFATAEPICTVTPSPDGYSSFVEAEVSVSFAGLGAYAIIDFGGTTAYIVDNFVGTFGSTEDPVSVASSPTAVPTMSQWMITLLVLALAATAYASMRGTQAGR